MSSITVRYITLTCTLYKEGVTISLPCGKRHKVQNNILKCMFWKMINLQEFLNINQDCIKYFEISGYNENIDGLDIPNMVEPNSLDDIEPFG